MIDDTATKSILIPLIRWGILTAITTTSSIRSRTHIHHEYLLPQTKSHSNLELAIEGLYLSDCEKLDYQTCMYLMTRMKEV